MPASSPSSTTPSPTDADEQARARAESARKTAAASALTDAAIAADKRLKRAKVTERDARAERNRLCVEAYKTGGTTAAAIMKKVGVSHSTFWDAVEKARIQEHARDGASGPSPTIHERTG